MKIAPRLKNGNSRVPAYSGLPQELKDEIARIAKQENCSKSWVIEQIILDWAGMKIKYKQKKE